MHVVALMASTERIVVKKMMFLSSRFIEVDIDTAMQRVLKRHISTGMYSLTPFNQLHLLKRDNRKVWSLMIECFYVYSRKAPRCC